VSDWVDRAFAVFMVAMGLTLLLIAGSLFLLSVAVYQGA
jgi:hypothetical protein